jgi:hypothetical protein
MTNQHSPAPWHYRVSTNCPDVWEITAPFCESPLAEVPRWQDEDGNDSKEAEANATLMTIAPALLAALESLADQADEDCPVVYRSRHFIEALETARDIIAQTKAA